MSMTRWDPFDDFQTLRDAMNQLIESSYVRPRTMAGSGQQGGLSMPLDVFETDNDIVVKASMPGVKPDDININITGNVLTISGETRSETEYGGPQSQQGQNPSSQNQTGQSQGGMNRTTAMQSQSGSQRMNFHRRERTFGRFFRQVALPEDVQADKADAQYEHGVLTLTIPKAEQAKPRQIKVRSGGSQDENMRLEGKATPVNANTGGEKSGNSSGSTSGSTSGSKSGGENK